MYGLFKGTFENSLFYYLFIYFIIFFLQPILHCRLLAIMTRRRIITLALAALNKRLQVPVADVHFAKTEGTCTCCM